MALDDIDREEIAAMLKAELQRYAKTLESAAPARVIEVRHVGVPLEGLVDPRRAPNLAGVRAASGDNCCNGCD